MKTHDITSQDFLKRIKKFLEARLDDYLKILEEMVCINSYTGNAEGVNRLGDYIANLFSHLGFTAERVRSAHQGYGNHLHLRKGDSMYTIGLISHLDTVFPPEEEERNNFRFQRRGNRVYGPGTVDVKGGTLIIYMLLESLCMFAPSLVGRICWNIIIDASEETESSDFAEFCVTCMGEHPLACLIYEGGDIDSNQFSLVTSRKGRANFLINAHGRGAHSGVDHQSGANAIVQLARVISTVHDITDYSKELTVNIGNIQGGGPLNRVPHYASCEVEIRAFDPKYLEEGIAQIMALDGFSNLRSGDQKFQSIVKAQLAQQCPAWPENPLTDELFRYYERAASLLGYAVRRERRGGLSDGNYLWNRLPVLDGLGPAGGNAHCSEQSGDGSKDQEYAVLSSFITKTMLSALAILEIIADKTIE